ncbi:Leucine-rich repeat-containing protein 4 [Saguinus oedipus]|uniref:Leucine-rich repeat-containing protein 4 n=1 Tax=Saguinus oedipus TaxID=9490 RepID=A0ABQ9U5I9_SAGOE|nr:Leucine-rich repeat-containing protein 4 [Saguinus oedipus]
MVTNVAGNCNTSAYLSVTTAELNTSNDSVFTTVTQAYAHLYHSALIQNIRVPKQVAVPVTDTTDKMQTGLDDVMKTTKIITGCFAVVTLLAAAMLIVFCNLL